MNYVGAIVIIIGWLDKLGEWLAKKGKLESVDNVNKIIDDNNDVKLADELRKLADKVEQRKKTA